MTQPDAGESPGGLRAAIARELHRLDCEDPWDGRDIAQAPAAEMWASGGCDRAFWLRHADAILALPELRAALAGRTQGEPVGWLVEFEPGRFVFADTEAEPIVYLYREEAEMSADEQRGCSSPWPGIRIVPIYRAAGHE